MNSQTVFTLASILVVSSFFADTSEARRGLFGRRSYSTARPTYTYRPTTTTVTRAAPAAAPAPATTAAPAATVAPASHSTPVAATPASASRPAATGYNSVVLNMLNRNNAIRTSRGMRPMFLSSRLSAAAQNHANYMASTGGFSHYSNGGPQGRAATYGFRGGVRENIAMGQPSVDNAFAVWTASGGHYANMMSHSDVAGFGYAVGANGQPYWVAVYGNNDGGN